MDLFLDALLDALIDSAKLVPLLFVIYVLIEIVEVKYSHKLNSIVARAGRLGPLAGALVGVVPQCGGSVVGTALYTQRLVTIGTLFSVYLATSDEAIPIIMSDPAALPVLGPLIGLKLLIAIVVGYGLDLAFRKRNALVLQHVYKVEHETDSPNHHHELAYEEEGCCHHEPAAEGRTLSARTLFVHPVEHTLKIFVFLLLISLAINLLFEFVGQDTIGAALEGQVLLQPFFAALVGLIPNCAASVAITEFYLEGLITFGACVAGLCASGGLGILVLLKEGQKREAVAIIVGLFAISVVCGLLVQGFYA